MYSDEVEESLNEEIIKIMMQDQSSNEAVAIRVSPSAPQRLEREVMSRTPSPRTSPCPSPVHVIPIRDRTTDTFKPGTLSPMSYTCTSMQTHKPSKPSLTTNGPSSIDSSKAGNASIKAEEEEGKIGDRTTRSKTGSSTMSALEATSFQKRLFGLQHPAAQGRKSHTLPLTNKTASSNSISDQMPLTGPLSPATLTDSPFPPPEPTELKYFESKEIKVRHLVAKMSHANSCAATMCSEICIYIKWYAKHRRSCTAIHSSEGGCEYCRKFIQWQYQHCLNCKCCPSKGCSDNISWCPVIKQSILKNKLESCIAPVVRKLQNGFCVERENSCPRQKAIERCYPEEYHKLLREHLHFNAGGGQFVEGEHWRKNKPAGRGRAGSCWIAELMECPFYFAVKEAKLDSSLQAKRNLDEAYCSVKMNYLNQHVCPHIIDYYGFTAVRQPIQNTHYFLEPPLLLQIHMELMACCLQSFVTDIDKNGPLLFDKVVDFSYQLFSALDFLHSSLKILHRDIKPGNILVAHNEQRIKLTDFDCAALLDEWNLCDVFKGDPQGTIHYNPPELYYLGQSSWSLDVWQVACCILFMCTGCRPWRHAYFDCDFNYQNRKCVVQSIQKKISSYPNHLVPGFLPTTLHTLLSKCLHSDWKNRLTPLDAMYLLDPDYKSRNKLLSDHDIIGSSCTVSAAPSVATHSDNTSVAVDVYLADYTERIRGLYLQPGWIASVSISHNNTVTYGDVKSLIYNNTELEVMRYLMPCDFYTYKNDRIKIRDLLIKEKTLDEFSKMNESDVVDPNNAIIMRYVG